MPRSRSTRRRAVVEEDDGDHDDDHDDHDDHDDEDSSDFAKESLPDGQESKTKDQRMREEWAILGQEYEIASHARTSHGHFTKKVPRNQWKARTKKRKLLEAADEETTAAALDVGRNNSQNRLRGSQKAFEKQVIEDSKIFPYMTRNPLNRARNQRESDSGSGDDADDSDYEELSPDAIDDDDDFEVEGEEGDGDGEEDDNNDPAFEGDMEDETADEETANISPTKSKKHDGAERKLKSKKRRVAPKDTKRRRLVRLRNFQSQRLARRHGDALAAHARGQHLEAIQLLKEVAKKAPSAPQVYSSLGMVYQDMLKECRSIWHRTANPPAEPASAQLLSDRSEVQNIETSDTITDKEKSVPDPALAEQLDLAKKAYGSYHVAAILYKKDYSLWVRAADAGADVVGIIKKVALLPHLSSKLVSYHREEWKRWQAEVLRDFQAADSLKPPGIDVPCKLASMHIELGNLSEALTILTDLKNRHDPSRAGRSEFQSSYKAWILYAELMLRVGHECMLWNQGIKLNDNYMFRRWLRKYSHVFDWQERRLQALCLALEAAAGTNSTAQFIIWMKNRTLENQSRRNEHDGIEPEDIDTRIAQADSERKLLLARHTTEVEDFDKTTEDMELTVNSKAARDREVGRSDLMETHRVAVATLDNEYDGSEKQPSAEQDDQIMAEFGDSMPLSGSCRQVCNIASELMKHLHGLQLFGGARLVGDAVSSYFRLRAAKHDERRQAAQRVGEWQAKMSQPSFLFATYDEASDEDDGMDGDSGQFVSDDEDLDREEGTVVLDSLRKGILSPELRVMYGLALIGEGGRNFFASKCLEAIEDLDQETGTWFTEGERETEISGEPRWHLFRRAMTEPLGRTAAYAFLADVLRKSRKEHEWSVHFAPWFRRHLATLASTGLKDHLMALREDEGLSSFVSFRKNQVLKIILAACSFDVESVERPCQKSPVSREEIVTKDTDRLTIAIATMNALSEVIYLVWKVEEDGSLSPICAEIVHVSSRCLRWLAKEATSQLSYNQLNTLLEYTRTILSFLSGYSGVPNHNRPADIVSLRDERWSSIPLGASWQADEYRPLSLKVFNLTVACNVSLFSGWEPDEFTLRLLRRSHGHKHFGVHVRDDKRLTGIMSLDIENEICSQWTELHKLLPNLPDFQVQQRLDAVKLSTWYKKEADLREKAAEEVTRYAEDSGERIFLTYSKLCLQLAVSERNPRIVNSLLHTSLSILLPVTQFCVDDRLWYSDIGEAACTLSGFDEWKLMNQVGIDEAIESFEKKPRKRRRSEKVVEKKLQEWIKGTGKPTWKSFVSLPLAEMRRVWFENDIAVSIEEKEAARACMESVHGATEKLRKCYTEVACEKVCLNIAKALLELAAQPGCYDPFRCLQQAAMYASQASKAGHSDMIFREKLPEKKLCTPLQALVILGRADCLHSTYFPNEAAFLLSYVALICRLRRASDGDDTADLVWSIRWKIVAIYAFNVSVLIRTTVSTVLDRQQQRSFLSMWDRDVVEELERGRSDGWSWKRSLSASGVADLGSVDDIDDFEADEAENSDGDAEEDEDENETKAEPMGERHAGKAMAHGFIEDAILTSLSSKIDPVVESEYDVTTFPMDEVPRSTFLVPPQLMDTDDMQERSDDAFQGIEMVSV